MWVLRDRVRAAPIDSTQDRENARGPAGYEPGENRAIPASSGWSAIAAAAGAVEKRLAETHLSPIRAVAPYAYRAT